jgi:hypothetical protein
VLVPERGLLASTLNRMLLVRNEKIGLSRRRIAGNLRAHGNPEMFADDHIVHTEFGADMWTYVFRAGFSAVSINAIDYPAALALSAKKGHAI